MWPFKKNKYILKNLEPGQSAYAHFEIPLGQEPKEITIEYDDEYGNKYETKALIDFKEKKIIKQKVKMVKRVKDIPENKRPKVIIDEKLLFDNI